MGSFLQLQWGAPFFLVALLFLLQGALALECHSCIDLGDGSCSRPKLEKVTCPASSQVCMEMAAAVEWSHGNFSVGEKGCGMGMSGTNDVALDLHGIVAFYQLHQCNSSRCNTKLDMRALELQPLGDEDTRVPNGVECYGCFGDDCTNSTIVKCYNSSVGCFHGNFTMKAGNVSLTKPIKGCVKDDQCTKVTKGSQPVTLTGSCCSGNLCNADLSNKTFFAHNIPPLKVLPKEVTDNTTVSTTPGPTTPEPTTPRATLPAPATTRKSTRSVTVTPKMPSHHNNPHHEDDSSQDNDLDKDHNDDHDAIRNLNNTEITSARDGNPITAVKVQERHFQQAQVPHSSNGSIASLGWSALSVLLLSALLL